MKKIAVVGVVVFWGVGWMVPAEETVVSQNSILEGISLTSEAASVGDEKTVTCYFIFRGDKPNYFWELRAKEKKLIFEFNDTKTGTSPIISQSEPPIAEFRVESRRINVNADMKGLTPEWHDQVVVTFFLTAIPKIQVTDEYSVVSFQYKWTTDASKVVEYMEKEKKNMTLPITLASVGGAGVITGIVMWVLNRGEGPEPLKPLSVSDLPRHTTTGP